MPIRLVLCMYAEYSMSVTSMPRQCLYALSFIPPHAPYARLPVELDIESTGNQVLVTGSSVVNQKLKDPLKKRLGSATTAVMVVPEQRL